jgi:tRNA A-37 threonylcarbamoyl transferase component Bud32
MPGTTPPPGKPPNIPPASSSVPSGRDPAAAGIGHARTNLAADVSAVSIALTDLSILEDMPRICPTCGVRYPAEFKVCPRDGSELSEPDELIGRTIRNTYAIMRVLGEGGMGRVYEARHTRISSKRFAIKMLHPEFARQPEVLSRFQREAEAAASIRSPYVVGVYDVDRTPDGRPYIVGEFLDGKELADHLNETGKMPVARAARIVRQICKALAVAHDKGVIHRDMKPENVFLTGDLSRPVAKVIDFGISRVGDNPGTALTQTGMIMGTPSYMAPEQAKGMRVDHRADIYAVGAVLYCALTGRRPFDRGDPTATLAAVLSEEPVRPRSLEPSIPEGLEMIIQRAMARDPAHRYQTMADLERDLAPYDSEDDDVPAALATGDAAGRGSSPGRQEAVDRQTREAGLARPMILLLSLLGIFWLGGALVGTLGAIVRMTKDGGLNANLATKEAWLVVAGLAVAMLAPMILAARYVNNVVWGNRVKAVALSAQLRRPVFAGLCAYGFGSMLMRLIETVLLQNAVRVASPVWDVLLFLMAIAAAVGAHRLFETERKTAKGA